MKDELSDIYKELVTISRFAIIGATEDSRLYVARMARQNRIKNPDLSKQLANLLNEMPTLKRDTFFRQIPTLGRGSNSVFGDNMVEEQYPSFLVGPIDTASVVKPILNEATEKRFQGILEEWKMTERLEKAGLKPTRTLFFVGAPGIGKTLSAYWLAKALELPLYRIDLATIVSSYLGQTGNNLKSALLFARKKPMVLLLDEIDALAKKRDDDMDVGEVKRIVTVLLQEIDSWPSSSMLIAATNNPELVDPALWRRFDEEFSFSLPDKEQIEQATIRFFAENYIDFQGYQEIFPLIFDGMSFSDIERQILQIRRTLVIKDIAVDQVMRGLIEEHVQKKHRLEIAKTLIGKGFSQKDINRITGVSRDTIRKYQNHKD
ncbi:MAG: ATP-binding protein [Methanomethylophilus sp.]